MTRTVWAEDQVGLIKPEFVAPLVVALCSEKPPAAGQLYEAGAGSFCGTRWQRARGVDFEHEKGVPAIEDVAKVWDKVVLIIDDVVESEADVVCRRSMRYATSITGKRTTRIRLKRAADTRWATS